MKLRAILLALASLLPAALFAGGSAKNCGCSCCKGKEVCCCNASADAAKPAEAKRYPLRGVITDIVAKESSLLVKHEPIEGYMPAMTMLFKVDAATLAAAQKGQSITATLIQRDDGFWLENVKPAAAK